MDVFRKYEMTLNWDEDQNLGTQTLLAHKNARFLKLWYETYHDYRPDIWYYNAGQLPTNSVLVERPDLIHRVKLKFGVDGPVVCPLIYNKYYKEWNKEFYSIHLNIRGNVLNEWCNESLSHKKAVPHTSVFDERVSTDLKTTFGEMTRILFNFEKNLTG